MDISIGPHLEESEIEQYSMGILPQERMDPFEDHYLACEACQDRLLEAEAYVNAMRSVSPKLREAAESRWRAFLAKIFGSGWRPVWVAVFGMGVVALAILRVRPERERVMETVAVLLQSSRGVEGLAAAKAPTGKHLLIQMDITELAAFPSYRLEVVDRTGQQVMEAAAHSESGKITQLIAKGLPAGQYFVRLYSPSGELLREFSLGVN